MNIQRKTRGPAGRGDKTAARMREAARNAVVRDVEDSGEGFPHRLQHAFIRERERTRLASADELKTHTLSITDVARDVGVSPQIFGRYMMAYLRPLKRPSIETNARIARRLGCGAGWLYYGGEHGRPA